MLSILTHWDSNHPVYVGQATHPSTQKPAFPGAVDTGGVDDRLEVLLTRRDRSPRVASQCLVVPRRDFFLGKVMENPITNWNNYINSIFKQTNFYIENFDMLPPIFMSHVYIYMYTYRERFPCPPFKLQIGLFLHVWRGTILLPWKLGRSSRRSRRRSWICPDSGGAHTTPVWESAGCRFEDASWWRRHVSWESKISKGPNPPQWESKGPNPPNENLPMLFAPRKKDLFGRGLWSPPWSLWRPWVLGGWVPLDSHECGAFLP